MKYAYNPVDGGGSGGGGGGGSTPATPVTFLHDTFTDADKTLAAHVSDSGDTWVKEAASEGGTLGIVGNQCAGVDDSGDAQPTYCSSAIPPSPDYEVSAVLHNINSVGCAQALWARLDQGSHRGYMATFGGGAGQLYEHSTASGQAYTQLGGGCTVAEGDTVTLRVKGPTITVLVNGVVRMQGTDYTHAGVGSVGIRAAAHNGVAALIDSLTAETLEEVPAPTFMGQVGSVNVGGGEPYPVTTPITQAIPAGALVVWHAAHHGGATDATFADSVGNVYHTVLVNTAGETVVGWSILTNALTTSDTLTYNPIGGASGDLNLIGYAFKVNATHKADVTQSDPPASGSISLAVDSTPGDLIIGFATQNIGNGNGFLTYPDASWTKASSGSNGQVMTLMAFKQAQGTPETFAPASPSSASWTGIALSFTLAPPSTAAPSDSPVPVADWRLNEASGLVAADAEGLVNGAYSSTGVLLGQPGPGNGDTAVTLDGASGEVTIPDKPALRFTGAFTIEAWIKPTDPARFGGIYTKGVTNAPEIELRLNPGGTFSLNDVSPGHAFGANAASQSSVPYGAWTKIAVTFDGLHARFYINGLLDATRPVTGAFSTSANPALIGNRADGLFFTGSISGVNVTNRVRTAADIYSRRAL